ncbi:uncharacterized protein LOC119402081 [Rhipicephalus sanguineus]|uniref:uncharacterized protein LOC119402081 n=1 Tax=Rhipicephalus sanguineus TaxID=34632 RepID=UPI00189619C5|nr:uncharacterized protein LOC119402081 [Rhipicephalus sanguineus]
MSCARALCVVLSAYLVPLHLASPLERGTQTLHERCLTATTVEGCDTILLSWSYDNETNECEKGFVCHGCPNRFDTFDDCFDACSTVSITTPKPRPLPKPSLPKIRRKPWHRGCKYWLMHGACCQSVWLDFVKGFWGRTRRALFYTGCRLDKDRVFAYDFSARKCREVKKRPRGQGEPQNENALEVLRDRERGCPRKTSRLTGTHLVPSTKPVPSNKPPKPTIPNQTSKPATRPKPPEQNKPFWQTLNNETSKPTVSNNHDKQTSPNQHTNSPRQVLQSNTTQ